MKKVIFWVSGVDDLYEGRGCVGGLIVQMSIWAETFCKMNWDVYSFTRHKKCRKNNITFIRFPYIKKISIFFDFIYSFFVFFFLKPDLIVFRGASRNFLYVSVLAKIFKVKLVHFGASDTDYMPKKELIKSVFHKYMYRCGIRCCQYFVAQNVMQEQYLRKIYNKLNVLVIPNVWNKTSDANFERSDILWVGNFRKLKRPEWFVELAKSFPDEHFVIVGAPIDKQLYEEIYNRCKTLKNVSFLGKRTLDETNRLFAQAKIYVCTSEIEGFPNTFLQAWSNLIPVVTTFNPSNIVTNERIGIFSENFNGIKEGIYDLIHDKSLYEMYKSNISNYFFRHDSIAQYKELIKFIGII